MRRCACVGLELVIAVEVMCQEAPARTSGARGDAGALGGLFGGEARAREGGEVRHTGYGYRYSMVS